MKTANSNLIEILKKETQSLKVQYIEKTKEWAKKKFDTCVARIGWGPEDWCKYFGLTPEPANKGTHMEFLSFPRGFYNTRNARIMDNMKKELRSMNKDGVDGYIKERVRLAEIHYDQSIYKLADRISKKGLNENKLTVETSHVGVNIDTVLTDGVNTVHAFTILAWGEVYQPHYRYLIK